MTIDMRDYDLRAPTLQSIAQWLPAKAEPQGNILSQAKARLAFVEREVARLKLLSEEAEQLRRMIAAAEPTTGVAESNP